MVELHYLDKLRFAFLRYAMVICFHTYCRYSFKRMVSHAVFNPAAALSRAC